MGSPDLIHARRNEPPVSYHVSGPPGCSFQLLLPSKKRIPLSEHILTLIQQRNGSSLGLRLSLSFSPSLFFPTNRYLSSNKSEMSRLTRMSLSISTNPSENKPNR